MKKIIFSIIPIVLLALIGVFYLWIPSVYRTWFVVRHLLVFMFIAYVLIISIYFVYNLLIRRYEVNRTRLIILRLFTVSVAVTLLFVISGYQTEYIAKYEIPPLIGCAYYDKYDNLVYTSQMEFICPELENLKYETVGGKEVLSFNVIELATGYQSYNEDGDGIYDRITVNNKYNETTISSSFEYVYFMEGLIEKVTIESFTENRDFRYYDYRNNYQFIAYKKIVENTFEDLLVTSTISTYNYEYTYVGSTIPDYNVPDFDSLEPEVVIYTSELVENPSEISNDYFITITEDYMDGDISVTNVIATGDVGYSSWFDLQLNPDTPGSSFGVKYIMNDYWNISITYDLSTLPIYPKYYIRDGIFNYHRFGGETQYLRDYRRLPTTPPSLEDVEVEYYEDQGDIFGVNLLNTSRIIETDYGKMAEYYSTFRNDDRSYLEILNNGEEFQYFAHLRPYSLSFDEMNDYKFMLFDYTKLEIINIYQRNPLLRGFQIPGFQLL